MAGHQIAEDVWYTANAEWLLYGATFAGEDNLLQRVACTWTMKILFSTDGEVGAPTLLTTEEPHVPDVADERCLAALKRLKAKAVREVTHLVQRTSEGLEPLVRPGLDLTGLLPKYDFTSITSKLDIAALRPRDDITAKLDIASLIPGFGVSSILPKSTSLHFCPSTTSRRN